jgi:hypothetical protein
MDHVVTMWKVTVQVTPDKFQAQYDLDFARLQHVLDHLQLKRVVDNLDFTGDTSLKDFTDRYDLDVQKLKCVTDHLKLNPDVSLLDFNKGFNSMVDSLLQISVLTGGLGGGTNYELLPAKVDTIQKENKKMQAEISSCADQMKAFASADPDAIKSQLGAVSAENTTLKQRNLVIDGQLVNLQQEVDHEKEKVKTAIKNYTDVYAELSAQKSLVTRLSDDNKRMHEEITSSASRKSMARPPAPGTVTELYDTVSYLLTRLQEVSRAAGKTSPDEKVRRIVAVINEVVGTVSSDAMKTQICRLIVRHISPAPAAREMEWLLDRLHKASR